MKDPVLMKPIFGEASSHDYLRCAEMTARWLQSHIVRGDDTKYLAEDPEHPEKAPLMGLFSLYSGVPGVVLFFLELSLVTGNTTYLDDAKLGADFIIRNWNDGKNILKDMDVAGSEYGPISGTAGPAFVLTELGRYTKERRYTDFAKALAQKTAESVRNTPDGPTWTNEAGGISYDAGILLYLMYEGITFENDAWKELAVRAADRLIRVAEDHGGYLRWKTITVQNIGIGDSGEMPNFFYGTAGTAFVLARMYEWTHEERFLDAAKKGEAYIKRICLVQDGKALTPFCLPNPEGIYFVGMCNGYAGTVRLFYELAKVDKDDPEHLLFAKKLTEGIVAAGAPDVHFKGYWNVLCMCCGTAAMLNAVLGLYEAEGDPRLLALSKKIGTYMLGQFTDKDDRTGCWYQSWHRIEPWIIDARIGYYDGNAGEGMQLLELYEAMEGKFRCIRLPDDPFPPYAVAHDPTAQL